MDADEVRPALTYTSGAILALPNWEGDFNLRVSPTTFNIVYPPCIDMGDVTQKPHISDYIFLGHQPCNKYLNSLQL